MHEVVIGGWLSFTWDEHLRKIIMRGTAENGEEWDEELDDYDVGLLYEVFLHAAKHHNGQWEDSACKKCGMEFMEGYDRGAGGLCWGCATGIKEGEG